MKYFFVMKFV